MRRLPLLAILTLVALPAFAAGEDVARLLSPAAGDELTAGSVVRERLAPPAVSPDPAPRAVFRVVEHRQPRPAAIPVRLQTRRFNE